MLRANLYDRLVPNIRTGQYLGKDTIGLYECDHLGFTAPDKDLEIWFQTGEAPLVRKISISYKNAPSRPRYTMLVSRFDIADVPDYVFQVRIPAGAQRINPAPLTPATQPASGPRP